MHIILSLPPPYKSYPWEVRGGGQHNTFVISSQDDRSIYVIAHWKLHIDIYRWFLKCIILYYCIILEKKSFSNLSIESHCFPSFSNLEMKGQGTNFVTSYGSPFKSLFKEWDRWAPRCVKMKTHFTEQ